MQYFNKQNDRIYAQSSKEASQLLNVLSDFSKGLGSVTREGVTTIFFVKKVKTSTLVYQEKEEVVKLIDNTIFNNQNSLKQLGTRL